MHTNKAVTPGLIIMMTSGAKPASLAGFFFTASGFSIALSAGSLFTAFQVPSQRTTFLSTALIVFLVALLFQAMARKYTLLSNDRIQKIKEDLQSYHVETLEKVTHDMRSLTATILGYADLLADVQFRCDENTLNSCHQTIIQQGERIDRLMDQVVIMTHLETGITQIKRYTFSLTLLLDGLIAETREQYERKISFENRIGEAVICGDALFLRMAILNLIDNGFRYSPVEQPLEVTLQPASAPGWIELAVRDQGIGIAPDQQDILFSRFGRIKNNQNRKSVGSGLGLYLVKIIIQEHQGTVKVKSQPGHGSTFSVSLPVNPIA